MEVSHGRSAVLTSPPALSYVWGSQRDKVDIELNGTRFAITRNLHGALKRLRHRQRPRMLWVDALCINQKDSQERAAQVSMMAAIYGQTARGLLWLGEEPDAPVATVSPQQAQEVDHLLLETDKFLGNLMATMAQYGGEMADLADSLRQSQPAVDISHPDNFRITRTRPCLWYGDERDVNTLDAAADPNSVTDSVFHAFCLFRMLAQDRHLHDIPYLQLETHDSQTHLTHARRAAHWLASRDWWSRIWTVQECVLPRDATIIYGPVEMPWAVLLNGILHFRRHRDTCCATPPGVHSMLNLHAETLSELHALRLARQAGVPVSLASLLHKFRHRGATDPLDKVYALLPLVTEWYGAPPLVPSYGKPAAQVYVETMTHVIQASGALDILWRPPEPHGTRLAGLPGWVPDLSDPVSAGATLDRLEQQVPLYNACGGVPAKVSVHDGRVLVLEGRLVDHVRRVSTTALMNDDPGDTFAWWCKVAEEELGPVNADWRDAFWRTLCGDSDGPAGETTRFRRAVAADESAFRDWCAVNGLADQIAPTAAFAVSRGQYSSAGSMSRAIRAATLGRAFMISRLGRMGLVPSTAVLTFPEADSMFVFPGAKSPVVLRSVGVRDIPGLGAMECHEWLGDCYLHGMMDGEGMEGFGARSQTVYVV